MEEIKVYVIDKGRTYLYLRYTTRRPASRLKRVQGRASKPTRSEKPANGRMDCAVGDTRNRIAWRGKCSGSITRRTPCRRWRWQPNNV